MIFIAGFSYLLGSIPFGYLLLRIFRGEDVRQSGSGNIGATNVSRRSPGLGALTLLLDGLKGATAVMLAAQLSGGMSGMKTYEPLAIAAFFAVAGHVFPVWLRFRGGKGVATAFGSFLLITPKTVLLTIGVFALLVVLFRYVSLGSIVAVALFPLFALRALHRDSRTFVFIAATSLLIIARHGGNLRRIYAGTESRIGVKRA